MNDPDVNNYSETQAPCYRFAASGNCSGCENEHHPNLSPALVGMVVPQQYRVPNEVGTACRPCIENLREVSRTATDPRGILTRLSVTSSLAILQMSVILAQSAVISAVRKSSANFHGV